MAYFHPQLAHFSIALLIVGVLFRALSLFGRPAFLSPAATTLLAAGTVAALLSVQSGTAAHGPVERIPGARDAVVEHEAWGIRTRNVFIVVVAAEAVTFLFWRNQRRRRILHVISTVLGVIGVVALYEAAEHGGKLVYEYAGGPGIRGGDPAHVDRLLLAGLYNEAMQERKEGHGDSAAKLLALAAERHPNDPEVQLAAAESLLLDRKDAAAALAKLRATTPPAENRALRIRHGMLTADALEAMGQREGAAAVLQPLATAYPDNARVKQRLEALTKPR